jgi:hypothetical protein
MKACPNCKQALEYFGLSKNPKEKDDEMFPTYRCTTCKKVYADKVIKNPVTEIDGQRLPKSYGQAIKLFESFNMRAADKIITANISLPDNNKNPLVWLGKISAITYISSKEGKENQQYIHETESPYPDFFVTADGKTFLVAGGKMIVKDGWLYF